MLLQHYVSLIISLYASYPCISVVLKGITYIIEHYEGFVNDA
jgi:hypothetical protein